MRDPFLVWQALGISSEELGEETDVLTLRAFLTIGQRHKLVPPGSLPFVAVATLRPKLSEEGAAGKATSRWKGAKKQKRTILSGFDEKARDKDLDKGGEKEPVSHAKSGMVTAILMKAVSKNFMFKYFDEARHPAPPLLLPSSLLSSSLLATAT